MTIWGDFQGLTGVPTGGRGVKKFENWGDVIYGWSLTQTKHSVYCTTYNQAERNWNNAVKKSGGKFQM